MAARGRRNSGFTLVEAAVAVAILGVLAALGSMAIQSWLIGSQAKGVARNLADLVVTARGEAIRTGVQHVVLFNSTPTGDPLLDEDGNPIAAMLARDDDGDGKHDAGEQIAVVEADGTGTLNWGVSLASEIAPGDPHSVAGGAPGSPWAIEQPGGAAANWLAYFPDGTPRAYSVDPFVAGGVGTGGGALYLTAARGNDSADYAVVLAPLGGVRVHAWDRGAAAWRN